MFKTKKGGVAKAPVRGPIMGKKTGVKASGASKLGETGKPAKASGVKAK